jgi:DNA polymerase I-like protein with 3'-5' exonuclease and polymerase domains
MSRADLHGLLWDDAEYVSRRGATSRTLRYVAPPETGWRPPKDFPNLSGVKILGLDTETKDLELTERGPGAVRGAAHCVGFSVSSEDRAWYFPIRHEYEAQLGYNRDPQVALAWLADVLKEPRAIVGANLLYDLEVLRAEGIATPQGPLLDVQFAEPLLDEYRYSYSLDELARIHLGVGKTSEQLYEWSAAVHGGKADGSQRANIWRSPPSLVGPYAEADALLPLQILARQRELLRSESLESLFELECGLIPLLLDMRFRGVRIDVDKAQRTALWLREHAHASQALIPDVDVWSAASLERAFRKAGHAVQYTEAGNPSFTKGWLEDQTHDLARSVLDVRLYEKAANPFVESYLLNNVVKGRVHCQFHPLRSESYGTRWGRFSSSNPNLQNIPSRHKIIGPALRSLYIPEEDCKWVKADYSQVEYRGLVHYAIGKGAEALRDRYRNDPNTDFHNLAIEMTETITGIRLDRAPAKNLNFGLVYGMGEDKLTRSLGVSHDVGKRLYKAYFDALPSVKQTSTGATRLANRRGYIRTILGRRRRFKTDDDKGGRKGTHAALNACLQGTAADIIKTAMLACYKAGLFADDACGIPHLTVHDELDWSKRDTARSAAAFIEAKHVMETAIKLRVPLLVKMTEGTNWGDCE